MLVFLVDDDDIFNTLNKTVIAYVSEAIETLSFKSGLELLNFIKESGDHFIAPEIMLLDIRMPDMNCFEFLDELMLMEINPLAGTKICVLSSTLDDRDLNKALSYPVITGLIDKPLTIEKFTKIYTAAS
ncbi:MAG: response regulator [Ferruginibacter sp.]